MITIKTRNIVVGISILIVGLLVIDNYKSRVSFNLGQAQTANLPLIQSNNLTYLGAFRVPQGTYGGYGFDFTGLGLAHNPANNSLFLMNHTYDQKVAEISIPTPVNSTNLSNLPIATLLQNPADIMEGNRGKLDPTGVDPCGNGCPIGGLLVVNNKLIGTNYPYYHPETGVTLSHFTSGLNLATQGDFNGLFELQTGLKPGFVSGHMANIPPEWQAQFGGDVLTGNCCISIIGRSSSGPSATVFNSSDLGLKNPVPAKPLLYYDQLHQTLGNWGVAGAQLGVNNVLYNGMQYFFGMVFPANTSTVLYFGASGMGSFCYGGPTPDPALHLQPMPSPSTQHYCYDPFGGGVGPHGYPYSPIVFAYDANDLVAVKNGTKNPWSLRPYAWWVLNIPWSDKSLPDGTKGAAYDPATQRIYFSNQLDNSAGPYAVKPVIHVFQVNNATPITPTPTLSLSSSPSSISSGSSSTLTWNSTNTTSCTATGSWNGSRGTSGTLVVTPTTTSTYTLSCTGTGGSISQSTTVTVTIPTVLVGDLNNDKIVNALDWSIMNTKWFTNDATADINKDGLVNAIDFSILNTNWGRTGS